MSVKIVIGADIVPTESNRKLFEEGKKEELLDSGLIQILENADFRIFNLEVPLTNKETPIEKCGPNLIAGTNTIAGLKAINPDFFTLANNHILDQGEQGLKSTQDVLDENEIAYAGAGKNLEEASKPYTVERNGVKLGLYCCAEHEFSIATEHDSGANPFDPLESYDHVQELKKKCDYVIVLYHGGKEHYRYPSPDLQRYCRKFIDKGADLVVCQHSHCIGCEEKYKMGTIVYGQGNFLFDHSTSEFWKTSVLIQIEDGKIKYIPLFKVDNKVQIADQGKSREIMDNFEERSREIMLPGFIEQKYNEFVEAMLEGYLWQMSGASKSKWLRIINRLSRYKFYKKYVKCKYEKTTILTILNYFECEAHREVIIKSLKGRLL